MKVAYLKLFCKKLYQLHREKKNKEQREWRKKNPIKLAKQRARYYAKHKHEFHQYHLDYYSIPKHQRKRLRNVKKWRRQNKVYNRVYHLVRYLENRNSLLMFNQLNRYLKKEERLINGN